MAKGMDGRTFAGLGISHEVARLTRSREMTHQSCDSIMGRASLLVLFSPPLSLACWTCLFPFGGFRTALRVISCPQALLWPGSRAVELESGQT